MLLLQKKLLIVYNALLISLPRATFALGLFTYYINPSVSILDKEKKISEIFIFAFFCGASKGLMKALEAFIKPFEVPQRSVKIKI